MGHGLRVPADIDRWHAWQRGRSPLRQLSSRLRTGDGRGTPTITVASSSKDADICVVVDATHASMAAAILSPLRHLPPERVALVLGPGVELDVDVPLVRTGAAEVGRHLTHVRSVLSSGHYTMAGAATLRATPDAAHFVAQHGAVTPFAPPLPGRATVLSWSLIDGEFWRSGRGDVQIEVVGSQLLWRAGQDQQVAASDPASDPRLTFLGQGHAAEVARALMLEAALRFCRRHDAVYRPHPSERDRLSRLVLRGYEHVGVTVRPSSTPLADLADPVVSVFSTGVLEAAARGRDAWVYFPRPPVWLGEFWDRYGMGRFGAAPTRSPQLPSVEPARRAADVIVAAAD